MADTTDVHDQNASPLGIDWCAEASGPVGDAATDVADLADSLAAARQRLQGVPVAAILDAVDLLSRSLLDRSNPLHARFPGAGLPFLGRLAQRDNIAAFTAESLNGLDCLDRFVTLPFSDRRQVRAFPRGLVVHWLAGNVPTLGFLSLISAMVTRNASLIRMPSRADTLLGELLAHFAMLGEVPRLLASAVAVVRFDHQVRAVSEAISRLADVRLIWGSDDSALAVKALPTKPTCVDLLFPDRTSFVIVGKDYLRGDGARTAARLIAHDASVFEQKACASPHTVLLATESDATVHAFAALLEEAMAAAVRAIPKRAPSATEAAAILNLRSQYSMFHEAWASEGLEYTILSDDEAKLGPAIGNRTLFVRKLPSYTALAAAVPPNVQSVGIAAEGEEYDRLCLLLGSAGVHRFTPLGAMTHFELPWDGIFVPHQMVRWTTRPDISGRRSGG